MAIKVYFDSRAVLAALLCLAFAAEVPLLALCTVIFASSRISATVLIDTVLILLVVSRFLIQVLQKLMI